MNFWINKYRPLAESRGRVRTAVSTGHAPFVDGSHRREPYLSCNLATISSICRGRNFAPRLGVGDIVVYLTTKGRYPGDAQPSNRLTAVLHVVKMHCSHEAAAAWLASEGLPVPPNCVVPGNDGLDADVCIPCSPGTRDDAEARYRRRAKEYPMYFICHPLWIELESPPIVTDAMLESALGTGSRSPDSHDLEGEGSSSTPPEGRATRLASPILLEGARR